METLNTTEIIKKLQKEERQVFTLADFARLFDIERTNTLYKKTQRLEEKGLIKRLTKGKYFFSFKKPNEFVIANFLYQPSYISLESALSFHGIITGFPYQISSMTIKKPKTFSFEGKEYQYSQISQSLFWGYEKKEDFLIADKEKALIDFLYLAFKGLRQPDYDEFDLSALSKKKLEEYFIKITNQRFLSSLKRQKLL
ncbi:MAG: hypothetical protein FJ044_00310 [Candidatus Cloacimonetes bacterium]|nr:hypothetical protein [Candidatus Cloacimonadota bacterium]